MTRLAGVRPAILLGLLLAVGPAAAQVSLQVEHPVVDPIPPDTTAPIGLAVEIPCDSLWPRLPDQARSIRFDRAHASNAEILVTGPSDWPVPSDACPTPDGTFVMEGVFDITPTHLAPGESPIDVRFGARLTGDQVRDEGPEAQAVAQVVVAYRGLIDVTVPAKIVHVDDAGDATLRVENLGNSMTHVRFEVIDGSAAPPGPLVLGSTAQGATETAKNVTLHFAGPGMWSQEVVRLRVSPESAKAALQGPPVELSILFRNQDPLARATPGPAMPLLLVGLALLSRRL